MFFTWQVETLLLKYKFQYYFLVITLLTLFKKKLEEKFICYTAVKNNWWQFKVSPLRKKN